MILQTIPTWHGGFWKEKEGGGKLNLNIMCGIGIHIQQDSSFLRLAAPQAARHYPIYLANLLILATESIENPECLLCLLNIC